MKTLKILKWGDNPKCEHEWTYSPTCDMNIGDNGLIFVYKRICKNCRQFEEIQSDTTQFNSEGYEDLLDEISE